METKEPFLCDVTEGDFELSPVELQLTRGRAHEFPLYSELNVDFDCHQLYQDFLYCNEHFSSAYLKERESGLSYSIDKAFQELKKYGFGKDTYAAVGLMKVGTQALLEEVPEYTKKFLQSFSPFCRAHYVVAQPGLNINPHIDCADYSKHGFRINIPIQNSLFYSFYENEKITSCELHQGKAWFINNAVQHSANNPTSLPRVSILLQVMSDKKLFELFLKGKYENRTYI